MPSTTSLLGHRTSRPWRLGCGRLRGPRRRVALVAGVDVDRTREQFDAGELVAEPRVLTRPTGPLRRGDRQYRLLRARVLASPTDGA